MTACPTCWMTGQTQRSGSCVPSWAGALRDADYWDWTPETLAETLGSYGAYLDA